MTMVRRSSPFGELMSLRQAMDRLFEDSFVRPGQWPATHESLAFPLDARVTGDALVVQGALPGIKADDVKISVENGILTIAGETHSDVRDESSSYLVNEIRRGSFSRSVSLPEGLEPERATASFEDGVLTLQIPRAERVKPRTITITPTTDGMAGSAKPGSNGSRANGTGAPSDADATDADAVRASV